MMPMDSSPDLGTTEDHPDVERRVRAQIREPRRSSVRSVWLYYYTNGRVRASTMPAGADSPAPQELRKESVVDETGPWDVAISFASKDEAVAVALREALQPPYRVFVYSKAQEHLAGRDGIEAFRAVFRERATLIVVLFRSPWGETPFTRVEKIAIEEFVLESGWEHLLFVQLGVSDAIPKWVP